MDADSFQALALRVIACEATPDERRALETEFAGSPSLRDEFEQLKLSHDLLCAAAPLTEAARATTPELPAWRVNELRTAVRQHFGPATNHTPAKAGARAWPFILRWFFGGSGVAALGFAIVMFCFANRTIEVGLYATDSVRGGDQSLTATDIPSAQLLAFTADAPFDQWQNQPLAWNERAKIWVDNEHDLLHIVRRGPDGVIKETKPLWEGKTDSESANAQRRQIKQLVDSLKE